MAGTRFLIPQPVNCTLNSQPHLFQSCNVRHLLAFNSYQKTHLDGLTSVSTLNHKRYRSTNLSSLTAIAFNDNSSYSNSSSRKSSKPVSAIFDRIGGVDFGNECIKNVKDALTNATQASLLDVHPHLRDVLVPFAYYVAKAWKIVVIVSAVWFLYQWKKNEFSSSLTSQSSARRDKQEILILERDCDSLAGLIVVALMALSLPYDGAIHLILFVGGIAGLAGGFAVTDIFKNVMGGLSMQLSKPFSVGDHIKIGSVEGQVVKMGLIRTSLMNGEEFPVLVPNGLFFDEAIVNKSRALCHPVTFKIPVLVDGLDKILLVSNEINSMLRSNSKVFLGRVAPDCYLSRLECSFAELTISCNLRKMNEDELHLAKEDILRQSVRIIKEHGVLFESP